MASTGRLRLPVLFCPDCRAQLVNHIFRVAASDVLVCGFCARRRAAGTVAALQAEWAGFAGDDTPVLDPGEAIELLLRLGAEPVAGWSP